MGREVVQAGSQPSQEEVSKTWLNLNQRKTRERAIRTAIGARGWYFSNIGISRPYLYLRLMMATSKRINSAILFIEKMTPKEKVMGAFREVYHHPGYYGVSVLVAGVLFLFNTLISNYKLLWSDFSILLFWSLVKGTVQSIQPISLSFLIIISGLAGIVVSMSIFLLRKQIALGAGLGSSGILVSILAPTCPSCALGLLSIVGLGGFLAILPFKGLELGFIGIIVLVFSVWFLARKITITVCRVPVSKKKK